MGPTVPRCAPREAKLPPESAKMVSKEPQGSRLATKMDQDSPKRAPEGAKSDEKELQDAKWEMLILALFFQ